MPLFKPISISLSPNIEKDDIVLVLKLIFQPWKWKKGGGISKLENQFRDYFRVKHALSFNSGRSALLAILKSLKLNPGDEVLFQAFTCNAVVNPIQWAGLKPRYIDCNEDDFNIDTADLKRKISSKSKALIVQHTFGLPGDLREIQKLCQEHNLILIEDCAHSLGAEYNGKKVGSFGRAAFFSFSRDKVISSVYGGMAITNDDELAGNLKKYQTEIKYPSYFWVKQQLLHPLLMDWLILPSYSVFGKYLLFFLQSIRILSKAVHWKEKIGKKPSYFPCRLPNALALLALNQFKKIEKFSLHRKELADFYYKNLRNSSFSLPREFSERKHIFLRFPIKRKNAHLIIRKAWKKNILIGDWYTSVVAPDDTKLERVWYEIGTCPKAEKLAKETLNLPTHINISKKEAGVVIEFLKEHESAN